MEPTNNFIPQNNLQNNQPIQPMNPGFIPKADQAPVVPPPQPAQAPEPAPAPVPTSFIPPSPVVAPVEQEIKTTPSSHIALWILALIVTAAAFGAIGYFFPRPEQAAPAAPVTDTESTKTYSDTKYGFEYAYPGNWITTGERELGQSNQILAMSVNPDRAGQPDTDVPIERIIVNISNKACEGSPVNMFGRSVFDTGWREGFGLIYYRDICVQRQGWPMIIGLSAYDTEAQKVLDGILASFRLTGPTSAATSTLPSMPASTSTSTSTPQ